MADFSQAVARTIIFEGGYVNNPHDSGGETYEGISIKNWPKWEGWVRLHSHPQGDRLDLDSILQGMVVDFYRVHFWQYDGINDQDVADKVFDLGVNVGKVHAVKILQQVVGTNQDGIYGPNTERLVNSHPRGSLTPLIKTSAEKYYLAIVQSHPEDSQFLQGWLKRAEA